MSDTNFNGGSCCEHGTPLAVECKRCEANDSRSSACSVVEDWQVIHSARYILEDLNHEKGMQALADLSGLPMGVITAAFQNIFPPNVQDDTRDLSR